MGYGKESYNDNDEVMKMDVVGRCIHALKIYGVHLVSDYRRSFHEYWQRDVCSL
mgnify:CR=1 FL=1